MELMITARIGTWEELMENMIMSTPARTTVERLRPFRGMGHTRPDAMTTGVRTGTTAEFQSTPENLALTQGPSLCKVWSTGTEHTEKGWIGTDPVEAESMFPAPSVLEGPSELLRYPITSDWRLASVSLQASQSPILGLKTTEWLCTSVAAAMRWPRSTFL